MYTLGIDTSNYATSLAVYNHTTKEVVCDLKRFLPVKQGECGLRQSDAIFHHTQVLPLMLTELFSQFDASQVTAIGVSERPRPIDSSYMPCFSAGVSVATAFAIAKNMPIVKATHQQGHIAAAMLACNDDSLFTRKSLVFHISGGTTELLLCNGTNVVLTIATTTDLYAGQAIDRIGVKLGLPFPSGEHLSALAASCTTDIIPKVSVKDGNCSLSGLQNQCEKIMLTHEASYVAKYCLSYIGHTIIKMLSYAQLKYGDIPVICAGGVMCSGIIRDIITSKTNNTKFVPSKFSSDNAIGVAVIAAREMCND